MSLRERCEKVANNAWANSEGSQAIADAIEAMVKAERRVFAERALEAVLYYNYIHIGNEKAFRIAAALESAESEDES